MMELSVNNREAGQIKSATAPGNEIKIEEKASVQTTDKSYLGINIQDVKTLQASLAQSQGRVPQAVTDKQQKLSRHLESIEKRNAKPVKETGGESSGRQLSSLITRIIGKYPEINREISNVLVKEELSSQSGDKLSAEISRNIANMPKLLQSDTAAGKALLEFVAQAVVAKLDEKTLSENWKKQIGDSNLAVIKNTNPREQQEISRVLDDSVKFIYKNQSNQLKANTGESLLNSITGNATGGIRSSAQNIQVRPTDPSKVTYLNMFTQIANTKNNPEVTAELLQKINNIIIKAAQIAIESNLIEPPTDKLSQIIEDEDFSLQDLKFVNNLITKAASGINNQPVSKSVLMHSSALNLTQKNASAAAKELTEGEINTEIKRHMDIIHNSNDLKTIESTLQKINELNKQLADIKARTVIAEATKPEAVQKAGETGIKADSKDVLTTKTETVPETKKSDPRSDKRLSSLPETVQLSKRTVAVKTDNSSGKLSDQIRQATQKQDSNQISQTKLNDSTVNPDIISKSNQQIIQTDRQSFASREITQMPRQNSEAAGIQQPVRQTFASGETPQMPRQSSEATGLQQPIRQAFASDTTPQMPRQNSEAAGIQQPVRQTFVSGETPQMPRQNSEAAGIQQPIRQAFASDTTPQMPRQSSEAAGIQQPIRQTFVSGETPQMPRQSNEANGLQQPVRQTFVSGETPQMPRQNSEAAGIQQPVRQTFASGETPQMPRQSSEATGIQQPVRQTFASGETPQMPRQSSEAAGIQQPIRQTFASGETPQMPRQSSEAHRLQQPVRQTFASGETPQMPRQSNEATGLQQPVRQTFASGETPQMPRQSSEAAGIQQPIRQTFASGETPQMPRQSSEANGLQQPARQTFASGETPQMPRQSSEANGLQQPVRQTFASGETPQMPRQSSEANGLQQPARQTFASGETPQMPRQTSEANGLQQPIRQSFISDETQQTNRQSSEPPVIQKPAGHTLSSGESSQSVRQSSGNTLSQRSSAETQQNVPVNRNSGDAMKSVSVPGSDSQGSAPSAKNRTLPPDSSDSNHQNSVNLRTRQQADIKADSKVVPAAKDIRSTSGNNQSDTVISSNERMKESVSAKTNNTNAPGLSGTSRSDRYGETNVSISSQPLVSSQRRNEISKDANTVSQRQINEGSETISRSQTAKEDTAVSVEKQEKINIFRRITNFFNPSGHRNQSQAKSSETSGSSAATEASSKRNQTSFTTIAEDPTPKAIRQFKNIQSTIQTANITNNSLSGIQNSGFSEMMRDLENESISSAFIPAAKHISSIFSQSLASTPAILQWLNYVDNPLSGNNNFSKGLRAWATMLVTIRMKQFGMEVSSPQNPHRKKLHDLQEKTRVDDSEQWPQNFLKHLTEHIDKMHQNQMQRNDPLWTNYVPLPTPPQNVKENCMSFSRKKSEGKKDSLELSFYFEIKNLGPVGIKVNYAKPDISVRATAETYEGYSKIRETMHFLEDRFKQLNLNCHDFNCTKGTVSHPNPAEANSVTISEESNDDGLNLRI